MELHLALSEDENKMSLQDWQIMEVMVVEYPSIFKVYIHRKSCLKKEGRKEMFYLTTHSTHFYLQLYGVGHMVKDHSDSERGNLLPPHGLLFPINSKGSFICIIPQRG